MLVIVARCVEDEVHLGVYKALVDDRKSTWPSETRCKNLFIFREINRMNA